MRRAAKDTYVGELCRRNHDFNESGGSVRLSTGHCVECVRQNKRNKYKENRKKELLRYKLYRQSNKETILKYLVKYRDENREKINASARERWRNNINNCQQRERDNKKKNIKKYREYGAKFKRDQRKNDPEKLREYSRDYYKRNSIRISLRNRVYRALNAYGQGKQYSCSMYGIDIKAISDHLGACPGKRNEWHIDHIRPLCSFDFANKSEIKKAFSPKNHQWLPAKENLIKSGKMP